jgi:hypothetical protein
MLRGAKHSRARARSTPREFLFNNPLQSQLMSLRPLTDPALDLVLERIVDLRPELV